MSAGIELILSAPDIKPELQKIAESWDEIIEREINAQKIHEQYIKSANEQFRQMEAQQKALKEAALQMFDEIESTTKEIKKQGVESQATADIKNKGIISTIKEYFNERAELKRIQHQIIANEKELAKLELRQRAIAFDASKGILGPKEEFAENSKKINSLTGSLIGLDNQLDSQAAKVEISSKKFAGLGKAFSVVKNLAFAAFAVIAAGAGVAFAAIIGIGKANDQVGNQFERTQKKLAKAKQSLSDALAPVSFTIGKLLEEMSVKLSDFFNKHSAEIFEFSAKLAGGVAGVFAFIGVAIDNTIIGIKKIGAEVDYAVAQFKYLAAIGSGNFTNIAKASAGLATTKLRLEEVNKEFEKSVNPNEAASKAFKKTEESILALGIAFFKKRNLTKEEIEAIKKLREEYRKLVEDIKKQIQELDIKEAGPFEGVILKAEIAAKAIEKAGARAVELALKFNESNKKVNELRANVARLAQAVRDDAVSFLTKQADDILKSANQKLDELKAKQAGTEDELKFSKEVDAQFKKLAEAREVLTPIINKAREEIKNAKAENREANQSIIDDGIKAQRQIEQTAHAISQIAQLTKLDFLTEQSEQFLKEISDNADDQLKLIKEKGDKLRETLSNIDPVFSPDLAKEINLKIKVNNIDQAIAIEKIRQIEESFKLFKETGTPGVIETDAVIRVKVEQTLGEIQKIQPDITDEPTKRKPGPTVAEVLQGTAELYSLAYSTINDIVVNSIDTQIAANDRLIESRNQVIDDLQRTLELEASFKEAGLANDYDLLKNQLEKETELRDAAVSKAEELAKKREKAQRAADTAQQLSSLVTAVANTFKGFSTIPIVGQVLAIASIAAMFASFAASKIQAAKLARAYKGSSRIGETFGMVAPGEASDIPGRGDGLSIVDSRGVTRGYVGGDEYLHKESVSRRHRKSFDYINENETRFRNVNIMEVLKNIDHIPSPAFHKSLSPDTFNHHYLNRISEKIQKTREKMIVIQSENKGISKKEMEEAVEKAVTKALEKQTNELKAFHDSYGRWDPIDKKGLEFRNSKNIKRYT